jgi:hypothetical protein
LDIRHKETVLIEKFNPGIYSVPHRPGPIEKFRYLGCCVKLSSNDPYRSCSRLFGSKPMPSHDRVLQRREIGRDSAVVKRSWPIFVFGHRSRLNVAALASP